MAAMAHREIDTRRPKRVQGWRDFVQEVGIIFIGVVIALAAGEIVDAWNWHREVEIVKDSLDDELSDVIFSAQERIKIADCQRQTLDRLEQLAEESHGTLVIRNSPLTRNRLWGSAAWEAAVASGTIAHMRHDERNIYANLFSFTRLFRDLNLRQEELWSRINAYRHPRVLTDESRARFVETVSELRALTGTMNLAAKQFVEQAEPLHIQLDPKDAATLREPLVCPMP
jgi:hypothetical protein